MYLGIEMDTLIAHLSENKLLGWMLVSRRDNERDRHGR